MVDGNSAEWRSLHTHVVKRRSFRGAVLGAELFAIVLTLVLVAWLAPWWSWFIVAAIAMPPLAHYGRPDHRPIVQSALTTPLVRKISTDAIVRAYEVAGLSSTDPKKPQLHLSFGSTMTRDQLDKGSQVVVYLPYGGTFAKVVDARPQIASGLDVAESQIYFTKDAKSERRHTLRVLDEDPLSGPAGRTPLLDCKQRSIWRKAPFGLDQFGRKVAICLMWISLLIGAQPRRGKTFAARLIALYAALDPYVDITLIDGKSSKDWQPLRYVAHRLIQGTHPTKDGDPVQRALDALYEIDRHIVHVNVELAKLPVAECPEGSSPRSCTGARICMSSWCCWRSSSATSSWTTRSATRSSRTCSPGSARSGPPLASSSWARPRSRPGSARATCSGCSTVSATTSSCGSPCAAPTGTCRWPSSDPSLTARGMTPRACRWAMSSRASASCTA